MRHVSHGARRRAPQLRQPAAARERRPDPRTHRECRRGSRPKLHSRLARRHHRRRRRARRREQAHRLPPLRERARARATRCSGAPSRRRASTSRRSGSTASATPAARDLPVRLAYIRSTRRPQLDPTLVEANRRQHDALLARREGARGGVDVEGPHARGRDARRAVGAARRTSSSSTTGSSTATTPIRAITWAIELVEDAVRDGRRPTRAKDR